MPSKFVKNDAIQNAYCAMEAIKHRVTEDRWKDFEALFSRVASKLTVAQIEDFEELIRSLITKR